MVTLTKEVQDLYSESYKTLLKEIKEVLNKWKDIQGHGLEQLILSRWQHSPHLSTNSMQFLSKSQLALYRNWQTDKWKCKGSRITTTIVKKNKVGRLILLGFKFHYKAIVIVIKTLWYWHKNRQKSAEQNWEPNSRTVLQNIKQSYHATHQPTCILKRTENICPYKTFTWMFIAASFMIAKSGNNWNVNQVESKLKNVVYTYNGIFFNHKKEWKINKCYNMNEPYKHYANWKKSNTNDHIFYDSIYMKYSH